MNYSAGISRFFRIFCCSYFFCFWPQVRCKKININSVFFFFSPSVFLPSVQTLPPPPRFLGNRTLKGCGRWEAATPALSAVPAPHPLHRQPSSPGPISPVTLNVISVHRKGEFCASSPRVLVPLLPNGFESTCGAAAKPRRVFADVWMEVLGTLANAEISLI